ncbi:MAG: sulfatase [Blastocatellia bacterium]|nr:sulfatase [Blastocatellia bacterium]
MPEQNKIEGRASAGSLIAWAVWAGLATGVGEAILLGLQKWLFHSQIHLGPQILWMSPLANAILFLTLGGLLAGMAARRSGPSRARVMRTGLLFLCLLSWLLLFERLQLHAVLLLAAGAAWRIAPRLAWSGRATFRSLRWAVALLLLLPGAWIGGQSWRERRALEQLPSAASDSPNVLVIVLDTVRAQNLSLYGYARGTTPQLERFATRGVVFDRAITTAPWTTPSHAGIFTGRAPHEVSAGWERPLDDAHPTLAEELRARGYATAGFVANTINCGYESGLDRGFLHYEDYNANLAELAISASIGRALLHADPLRQWTGQHEFVTRKSAADVNESFLAWLSRPRAGPFFAFLNYFDAHEPYLPPPPFDRRFGAPAKRSGKVTHRLRMAWRSDREKIGAEDNHAELAAYDGAIAYLDEQLGALFTELDRRDLLQKTLVIVTSDHGEAFGEHGRYAHGEDLYLTSIHVPLLIVLPGVVPAGVRVAPPVSLRDLPATIMDLLGVSAHAFPGESLALRWQRPWLPPAPVFSEVDIAPIMPQKFPAGARAVMRSMIVGNYQYIKNVDATEEVYDILRDPGERNDLHTSRAVPDILTIPLNPQK